MKFREILGIPPPTRKYKLNCNVGKVFPSPKSLKSDIFIKMEDLDVFSRNSIIFMIFHCFGIKWLQNPVCTLFGYLLCFKT